MTDIALRPTGLKGPDRPETRTAQLERRRFFARVDQPIPRIAIQAIARIRRQPVLGDCVGEAAGGGYHALTGYDCSGRDIWREAQRQETGTFDPEQGAFLEFAVDGMIRRGLTPYVPGEEFDESATLETWVEGHAAHDRRQLGMDHRRIATNDVQALYQALASGMAVFDGGPLLEKFFGRGPTKANTPADIDELGGITNGHAQRIRGYYLDADLEGQQVGNVLLYQGSWDEGFAGCWVPVLNEESVVIDTRWQPGCFWAYERVIGLRWDIHAFRPVS